MKNTPHIFGQKILAVMMAGVLTMGLELAGSGMTQAVDLTCPPGLSIVEGKTVYDSTNVGNKLPKNRITYTCSNLDGSIIAERSITYGL